MPLVSFESPFYLLLFLLLPFFWWLSQKRSLAHLPGARRTLALALRLVIASCLVLALAGVHLVKQSGANCVLFVIDSSYSVPRRDRQKALDWVNQATRNMRGQDKVGVLTVGGDARLAFEPSERGRVACDLTVADGSQTNLARGITTALSYFPENTARRIVLVSDGNETAGSALEAARSAVADEVPIDVIGVGTAPERESLLERMLTPPSVKRNEPFPLKIVATSVNGGTGTVQLYRNGKNVGAQKVTLKPGKNIVNLEQKTDAPGFYTYEARLQMDGGGSSDTIEENNKAVSFVKVEGKPRLLLVKTPDNLGFPVVPESFLPKALAAQNVIVDEVLPGQLPTQAASLLNYDGIVLSDVPAEAMTPVQQKVVQEAVRDLGLGLTMIGGEHSFGAGGYFQTPIEEALPVDMDVRKMRRFPGVALAMAIDYSGSMNSAGRQTSTNMSKLELAREAADEAVDTLSAQDQVGVLAVDTQANVVVPLQYATDKRSIHAGIGAIYGGSGTEMSAAVKASYEMISKADARIKHIILVTDGETGPFDYGQLIEAFREKKITFTLIIIDDGQSASGIDPLKRIVTATGGRYYLVRDPAEIPKIYTREVQTISKPPILEEPFLARVVSAGSPLLSGINWESAPPLLGYDVVNAKPTAEVALASHKGDPVLATWQYGLGKAVAFTSDAKARWGAQWAGGWPGYGPFWAQTLRWSLKKAEAGSYQSQVEMVGNKGQISVDAVDEKTGAFVNFLDAKANVIGPDGQTETVRLTQTGAGRYVGTFDAGKTGSYVATVSQKGADGKTRAASVGLAVPYSPEYAALKPNTPLLLRVAEITGGKSLTNGEAVFQDRRVRKLPVPLAFPLLFIALLLFPLDVAVRRLFVGTKQAEQAAGIVKTKLQGVLANRATVQAERAAAVAAGSSIGKLNQSKRARSEQATEGNGETVPTAETPRMGQGVPPPPRASGVVWGSGGNKPEGASTEKVAPKKPAASPPSAPSTGSGNASGGDTLARLREAKKRAKDQE